MDDLTRVINVPVRTPQGVQSAQETLTLEKGDEIHLLDALHEVHKKCQPRRTQAIPVSQITGVGDISPRPHPVPYPNFEEGNMEDRMAAFAMCAHALRAGVLSNDNVVTAFLTLWRCCISQTTFNTGFGNAALSCKWRLEEISLSDYQELLIETRIMAVQQNGNQVTDSERPSLEGLDLATAKAYTTIISILLTKQITSLNHSEWVRRRVESFADRLGLNPENRKWMLDHKQTQLNCAMIYRRLGQRTAFRRIIYDIFETWSKMKGDADETFLLTQLRLSATAPRVTVDILLLNNIPIA